MVTKALNDLSDDPAKLREVLLQIRETEERLTDAETAQQEARMKLRECNKDVDGIRKELRRVTKYGPDPQKDLPFVPAGEEQPGELDPDDAAAVLSYNGKKAKAADAAKKKSAKKKAATPF
jgi:hypothetical protein